MGTSELVTPARPLEFFLYTPLSSYLHITSQSPANISRMLSDGLVGDMIVVHNRRAMHGSVRWSFSMQKLVLHRQQGLQECDMKSVE